MKYDRLISRSRVHNLALVAALISAAHMTPVSMTAGLLLFFLGFALQIWSKAVLRRDKQLCTQGPYAICRHPFYLANGLLDWGLCIMAGHWAVIVLFPVLFLVAYIPTAKNEEKVLAGLFPEAQDTFLRTTPRFFPVSLRAFRDWRSPVSWDVLVAESQVSRSVRHAALPLLVIVAGLLWADPGVWCLPHTAWITTSALGLLFFGQVVYRRLEAGSKYGSFSTVSNGIVKLAPLVLAIGIPLVIWKAAWLTPLLIALAGSWVLAWLTTPKPAR